MLGSRIGPLVWCGGAVCTGLRRRYGQVGAETSREGGRPGGMFTAEHLRVAADVANTS